MNVIENNLLLLFPVGMFNRYSFYFDKGNNHVNGTYIYA